MPVPTTAELDQNLNKFQFLCKIPTLDITSTLAEDNCIICQDSYQNNNWELDGTLHRPVALPCGHIIGFQCLARWVLSANFNNHCPLGRKQIVYFPNPREQLSRPLAISLARVEAFTVFTGYGISSSRKNQQISLLHEALKRESASEVPVDQIIAAWEEFLNMMSAQSDRYRGRPHSVNARTTADVAVGTEDELVQTLVDSIMGASLFCAYLALAYLPVSMLWDLYFERMSSLPEIVLGIFTFVLGSIIHAILGQRKKWQVVLPAVILGVVAGVLVREYDFMLYQRWIELLVTRHGYDNWEMYSYNGMGYLWATGDFLGLQRRG